MAGKEKKTAAADELLPKENKIPVREEKKGAKNGKLLFSKGQIISAMKEQKDPLTVLLDEGKSYTLDEVNMLLKKFFERKVK